MPEGRRSVPADAKVVGGFDRAGGWVRYACGQWWKNLCIDKLAAIVLVLLMVVPALVVGALFFWAARKDGQEDLALQKRLGIRRRTRLGR